MVGVLVKSILSRLAKSLAPLKECGGGAFYETKLKR